MEQNTCFEHLFDKIPQEGLFSVIFTYMYIKQQITYTSKHNQRG